MHTHHQHAHREGRPASLAGRAPPPRPAARNSLPVLLGDEALVRANAAVHVAGGLHNAHT
ncbi:MAG TPA: hypothetical protein VGS06_26770 [Streptosporangiaceae bacterium]|nr:hypothetical protein [Streptosporangiaceae bacterium]